MTKKKGRDYRPSSAASSSASVSSNSHFDMHPKPTGDYKEDIFVARAKVIEIYGNDNIFDEKINLTRKLSDIETYEKYYHVKWPHDRDEFVMVPRTNYNDPWTIFKPSPSDDEATQMTISEFCKTLKPTRTRKQIEEYYREREIALSKKAKLTENPSEMEISHNNEDVRSVNSENPLDEKSEVHTEQEEEKIPEDLNKINSRKPNPVSVTGIKDVLKFSKKLSEASEGEFTIKVSGKFIKIFPNTFEDKEEIIEILRESNIQFYNTLDRTPIQKAVIRGLGTNFSIIAIKEFMEEKGFEIQNVSQLKSKKDQRSLPLYLVQITKNEKSKEIFNIKSICNIRIQIEKFRTQKKATQCFNCQNFFHVAAQCFIKPRCVGCGEEHNSKDCTKKNNKEIPPLCCNCGESHPANYKGCKKYLSKPQMKIKTYAEIAKKQEKVKLNQKNQNQTAKPQNKEKNTQIITNELYKPEELSNITDLLQVIKKIKEELNIKSFKDLTKKLSEVLNVVSAEKNQLQKAMVFFDKMSESFPDKGD